MITVKAPGKLYIAGEYAVVEPGHPAILIAVDQFIQVQAHLQSHFSSAWSDQSPAGELEWHHNGNQVEFSPFDRRFSYVASAIQTTEEYLRAQAVPIRNYHLKITSELDSDNGQKYGLGSSAAVTVAVVKAICKVVGYHVDLITIFKLAAIAHLSVQGNGSLGDVAASVYQGWIAYQSFDRKWLLNHLAHHTIADTVAIEWPHLKIEALNPPAELQVLIGWTGRPASTAHLVGKVANKRVDESTFYNHFLTASNECVNKMIQAFRNHDLQSIQEQIHHNRQLLVALANHTNVNIETPQLKQMCDIVNQLGGAAKSSGAGGGDCGIAIVNHQTDLKQIIARWHQFAIDKLPLRVSYNQQEESHDQPSFTS
ncbi:phosphomevalonate kinase [Lactobacillus sp. Sy-1]|uniref:phosphomevalonate kinase n=1 Tax=Lactobacillus sp. Sy-1 TaxID=2109645 RepID=UPI001C59972A|nr:phosphomevalonate kinase [Lactobacillus sp. Sy-1]MBW1605601.1 phosphomevalonate kinase [Lactobacillus sp. Sy-1]